jgi:hypothetical protein
MSDLDIKLNIKDVANVEELVDKVKQKLTKDLQESAKKLAQAAHSKAHELSKSKMPKELADKYGKNLYIEQVSENIYIVGIREEAFWIENGRKAGFMEDLLTRKSGSPVKTSKDGKKYRTIPFEHDTTSKAPMASPEGNLISELKTFLKKEGVPYSKNKKLVLDDKGSPRIGTTHSFSIKDTANLSKNLQGVNIVQSKNPRTGKVERTVMTYRVISEKHKGSGKWEHPGSSGFNVLKDVHSYVKDMWEKQILPELKKKYGK